jgi:hypothetical protein
MLPSYKIVIGAFLLSVVLFAMTGVGIVVPETYTRIGEMPEVGRPMMQRMVTDEPEQARFHILNLARRSEELGRLRQLALLDVSEPMAVKPILVEPIPVEPAVVEKSEPDAVTAPKLAIAKSSPASAIVPPDLPSIADIIDGQAPTSGLRPDGALGTETEGEAGPGEAPTVAALSAPSDDVATTAPVAIGKIRIPRNRPAVRASIRRRSVSRTHRVARAPSAQPGLFGQSAFQSSSFPSR